MARLMCRTMPDHGGGVAQLGERNVRNVEVVGSNPIASTMLSTAKSRDVLSRDFASWGTGGAPLANLA